MKNINVWDVLFRQRFTGGRGGSNWTHHERQLSTFTIRCNKNLKFRVAHSEQSQQILSGLSPHTHTQLGYFNSWSLCVCARLCLGSVYQCVSVLCRLRGVCLCLYPASYLCLCGRPCDDVYDQCGLHYSCDLWEASCCGLCLGNRSSGAPLRWSVRLRARQCGAAGRWSAACWGGSVCWCFAEDISTWKRSEGHEVS